MKNLADENAASVRRGYEAFNKADMKTLTETLLSYVESSFDVSGF